MLQSPLTGMPTYFAPWAIEGIGLLVDGGTGVAGNPVYQACVEAFEYTGEYQPEDTIIVSLGTGRFLDRRRPTWLWPWVQWVLSELFRSPGEQQTALVERHYAAARFYRIDVRLPNDIPLDASRAQLDQLEGYLPEQAREVFRQARSTAKDAREQLRSRLDLKTTAAA